MTKLIDRLTLAFDITSPFEFWPHQEGWEGVRLLHSLWAGPLIYAGVWPHLVGLSCDY
jgi:hypothetical protein